jgi:phosphoribosylformylglycinamidine synthase
MKIKTIVLRSAGTNCDKETAFAFRQAGSGAELVHINSLLSGDKKLKQFDILAIPGGFSYGDDIAAGKVLANELKYRLTQQIRLFASLGKPIIGICNGFQVLVKAGLLPGISADLNQAATLTYNDSGKFEDRWVYLKSPANDSNSFWVKGMPEVIYLPVAHAEGKFICDNDVMSSLNSNNQIAFRYCDQNGATEKGYPANPNSSYEDIAGITNKEGNILGMMPHPERFLFPHNHPGWTRNLHPVGGLGRLIFKNAVDYVSK